MNKRTVKNDWGHASGIFYAAITMVIFGLLVSFAVEALLKESFRLG